MKISSKHLHSQTVRAREPTFWEKVHFPPPVTCHVSHIPYHRPHVTCHMSLLLFFGREGQSGEAIWWRVCYHLGLPRLVLFYMIIKSPSLLIDWVHDCIDIFSIHTSFVASVSEIHYYLMSETESVAGFWSWHSHLGNISICRIGPSFISELGCTKCSTTLRIKSF